jgi:transketolase
VVHALAAFLVMRAFEFVRTDVGIAGLPVKLVGYVPGLLSEANGPTHQALEDVALMRGIPGMNVYCPADEAELAEALPVVVDDPAPWYVRFPHAAPVARFGPFAAGRAEVVTAGNDVAILTYGLLLHEAVKAARILEARGVASRVVHLRTLKPVDEEAIVAAARETRLLVTLEDHFVTGGLYSIAAELLLRRGLAPRTLALGLAEGWFKPALLSDVLAHERLDGEGIAERVLEVL